MKVSDLIGSRKEIFSITEETSVHQAAQYLRVAHRTVLEWAKTGKIPAHRLSGTQRCTWRFRAHELDDAMMAAPSAAENGESFNATGK